MIHVFTSAAVNYLPKVRMLSRSIKKYHPDWVVNLVLADKKPDSLTTDNEPFDRIITMEELSIPDLPQWLFYSNLVELSTAIKPFALRYLLNQPQCDGVIYMDPDTVAFSKLSELEEQLKTSNILLTPHLTQPETTMDAVLDNEICSLRHGIFNLGFVAVKSSDEGKRFATWWADRLYHFCVSDWTQGLFTDQRWVDFAPVFFDKVMILKSPRFNVAPWNLSQRKISGSFEEGFKVNGETLGFYHFTGFDSGAHKLMSDKYAPGNQSVESLVTWYKNETAVTSGEKAAWGYAAYDNGIKIEDTHRKIYQKRPDLHQAFPNPYSTQEPEKSYYQWLMTQGMKEYPELKANAAA